ncbi:hypothetical protein [Gordonia soli]|uniref:Uncharacterized protein n=1 Tax=Gordonia soli NBRC 108243 TaxID=1223545 RepID=M0QG76_9ACTN|nr:hypothetical protein [Gordonia soli]GAC67588.1 hypothetical protein GS4_08_01730 [Gordonia soli NBRC 108243]
MATLVTSDELDINLLFSDPVQDVLLYLQEVVRQREPLGILTGEENLGIIVNLANIAQVTIVEHDDSEPDEDDKLTLVISIAEIRSEAHK